MLQKLRQAMVRIGRDTLAGPVEVDETYVGGEESGVGGRQLVGKALVVIAVELDGKKVGRIRLRHIPDASGQSLVGFITDCVVKGAKVHTDDWNGYNRVQEAGYIHQVTPIHGDPERALKYFPHVHLVASLIKRWLGATHQGKVTGKHLQRYLDDMLMHLTKVTPFRIIWAWGDRSFRKRCVTFGGSSLPTRHVGSTWPNVDGRMVFCARTVEAESIG